MTGWDFCQVYWKDVQSLERNDCPQPEKADLTQYVEGVTPAHCKSVFVSVCLSACQDVEDVTAARFESVLSVYVFVCLSGCGGCDCCSPQVSLVGLCVCLLVRMWRV